jgi:hypothetical protein
MTETAATTPASHRVPTWQQDALVRHMPALRNVITYKHLIPARIAQGTAGGTYGGN